MLTGVYPLIKFIPDFEPWGISLADGVGVAIVGTGFAGRMHALAARAVGARLVGVSGSDPQRSRIAAAAFGADAGFADPDGLISDPAVDVVHVCTRNSLHAGLVETALKAGKHVVCEKPLATTADDAARLAELARESGLSAATCFAYRFQPVARQARDRVRDGELGRVQLLHGSYLQDWLLNETDGNWRTSAVDNGRSRAFADIGSHWCDLAEWITGERILELAAIVSRVHERRAAPAPFGTVPRDQDGDYTSVDTEDAACVVFRGTNGIIGSLTVSQVSPGRKNRLWLEVDGSRSSVVFNQEEAEWLWLGARDSNRTVARGARPEPSFPHASALPAGHARGFVECFAEMFANVYVQVRGEAAGEFPTFEDGLRSTVITEAVLHSADEKKWVKLP